MAWVQWRDEILQNLVMTSGELYENTHKASRIDGPGALIFEQLWHGKAPKEDIYWRPYTEMATLWGNQVGPVLTTALEKCTYDAPYVNIIVAMSTPEPNPYGESPGRFVTMCQLYEMRPYKPLSPDWPVTYSLTPVGDERMGIRDGQRSTLREFWLSGGEQ